MTLTTKHLSGSYYDITETFTGKYLGSVDKDASGFYNWYPFLPSRPMVTAFILHSIATFLDSLNDEATKPAYANSPTATD